MENFNKPASSIDEQIQTLQSRGLILTDLELAKHCLSTVSYYRLSGYFKPFQNTSEKIPSFNFNTSFEQI